MRKWYQKSMAVLTAAACLFAGGTIGLARDSLPQLQLTAEAETYTGESDGLQLEYEELEDGTIGITKFVSSSSTDIELPSVIDGKSVTSIGSHAFYYCTNLTSVMIPDSVISIGDWAFDSCTSLTEIIVDSNNKLYISKNGILFNKKLETIVCYPGGKTGSFTIPDSVMSIGDGAFRDCTGLTSVTIPDSVTSIGYFAFSDCSGLTSVTIPESVTSIGSSAFGSCTSLTEIIVDSNNKSYISKNGILFDKNLEIIMCYPGGKIGSFTIPDSVMSIGDSAFRGCTGLTSVTIPDSVTSIGWSAFDSCTGLTSVTIPNNVTSIEDYAFYNCDNLTDIYYNGTESKWNEISIGDSAIPSNVTIHYESNPVTTTTTITTTTTTTTTATTTTGDGTYETIYGDVNGNNLVEVSDAVEILKYYAKKAAGLNSVFSETPSENEAIFNLADVNKDGEIDVQDAVLILTYYAQSASGGKPTWDHLSPA